MEWVKIIGMAIDYIEAHLLEDITVEDTANFVHISPFYFHKGFVCYVVIPLRNMCATAAYHLPAAS